MNRGNNLWTTLMWLVLPAFLSLPIALDGYWIVWLAISLGTFVVGFCTFQYLETGKLLPKRD